MNQDNWPASSRADVIQIQAFHFDGLPLIGHRIRVSKRRLIDLTRSFAVARQRHSSSFTSINAPPRSRDPAYDQCRWASRDDCLYKSTENARSRGDLLRHEDVLIFPPA